MRKSEIIREISKRRGIEALIVKSTIEAFMASVKDHVTRKETVSLHGFGNFIVKRRAAKVARNISKNAAINLPPYYTPVFRPSRKFSEKVRKNCEASQ